MIRVFTRPMGSAAPWTSLAAGLVGLAAAAACSRAPVVREDPFAAAPEMRELRACETAKNRTLCGAWTWDGPSGVYLARWENSAAASLKLTRYTGQQIVLSRDDEGGATPGLVARYVGNRTADGFAGTVSWAWDGKTWGGTWEAKWGGGAAGTEEPPR